MESSSSDGNYSDGNYSVVVTDELEINELSAFLSASDFRSAIQNVLIEGKILNIHILNMMAYKIRFGTVPSPEVTKSDVTIGFRVVDLPGNKVWSMDFSYINIFSSTTSKPRSYCYVDYVMVWLYLQFYFYDFNGPLSEAIAWRGEGFTNRLYIWLNGLEL